MELSEVSELDKIDYNRFVANAETGSFLQAWGWGEWQAALGRQVFRYQMLDDDGTQIASIQLIKMPLPFGKYYLYAPYGPVIMEHEAPVPSGTGQAWNMKHFLEILKSKFPDCVFIRIEPKLDLRFKIEDLRLIKTKNIQPAKTLVIDLSKSEEQLQAEMHHKTRYNIKVAQKHGVEIKDEFVISIRHGLFAKEAVELIVETSNRQGFKGYGAGYYEKMIDYFTMANHEQSPPPNLPHQGGGIEQVKLHIYKAIFQNQLLASAIMVDFSAKGGSASGGGTRTFLFGGSSLFHKNVMAPYLMHWQAILDAKNAGLMLYDFWGVETSKGATPGFVRFKLGFSEAVGGVKEYKGAYDIVNNHFLYGIYKVFRHIHRLL